MPRLDCPSVSAETLNPKGVEGGLATLLYTQPDLWIAVGALVQSFIVAANILARAVCFPYQPCYIWYFE